jgi:hypothetical protein
MADEVSELKKGQRYRVTMPSGKAVEGNYISTYKNIERDRDEKGILLEDAIIFDGWVNIALLVGYSVGADNITSIVKTKRTYKEMVDKIEKEAAPIEKMKCQMCGVEYLYFASNPHNNCRKCD